MFDAIVCGAGPAGSVAATLLARAGARVLVVDRARFPRDKLCGDTVNPGALQILHRHGLSDAVADGLPVDGMIVTGANGVAVQGRYGEGVHGRAIVRRTLDARLVAHAAAAGAQIDDRTLVTAAVLDGGIVTGVITRGRDGRMQPLHSRVVIGADGRHSRISRQLGLSHHPDRPRRWAIGTYFQDVRQVSTCGEMHVREDRYIGVAPLGGGVVNACVVTSDRGLLRYGHELLLETLRSDPMLRDRFAAARTVAPIVSLGPMAVDCPMPGREGLLLAGDAAGFIDPMTGDGLRFALRGAELAAELALDALGHGWNGAHLRLAEARRREFLPKWRFNRALRSLVASPTGVRLAGHGASVAPVMVRTLIRYAADLRAA